MYDVHLVICFLFFFNDTATTEIYTLSLHDALPISGVSLPQRFLLRDPQNRAPRCIPRKVSRPLPPSPRSEEHTSELQSRENLVCRLLLEKKKKKKNTIHPKDENIQIKKDDGVQVD